jgi:hypothetical protein
MIACQTSEKHSEEYQKVLSNDLLIVGDFDTAKIISQLAIKESNSRIDLSNEKLENLSDRLDTLELTYYFGFCDCQRWIISKIHNKILDEHADLDKQDARGQIEFDLDKHGYYIEAANKELAINWRTEVNGTTIRFIGREYNDKRLPKDGEFTVPDPPKGNVFRYYSYQIIRPYQLWGPFKFIEVDKETGDSINELTKLTVK